MSYAAINGQKIFYEDSGGHGYPIIMMHGFLMDLSLFDPQVEVLSKKYRCIRFDARAFGKTQWDKKEFTLYDTVSDCLGLLDYLNIPCAVVIGMSQGGYAALRLAINHRDRVKALVLMSTQAGIDDQATIAQYTLMRDTWINAGSVDALIEGLATVLLGPKTSSFMENVWNRWLPKWKTTTKTAIFHAMNNLLFRDEISADLKKICHPVLITHGDADFGMPIHLAKSLSENLKNCKKFLPIKGAAHAANFTHPKAINDALIDFLESLPLEQENIVLA
jgi:pimeloyl-ACP methyl ester carboxylesterase